MLVDVVPMLTEVVPGVLWFLATVRVCELWGHGCSSRGVGMCV